MELQSDYLPWYTKAVATLRRSTMPLQLIALLSGFATSILAAIFTGRETPLPDAIRVIIIVLPALGSALSTFIVQAKLFERYQLRENGRLAIQSYHTEAKAKYAFLKTDEELFKFHDDLRKRVDKVEALQSDRFFGFMLNKTDQQAQPPGNGKP